MEKTKDMTWKELFDVVRVPVVLMVLVEFAAGVALGTVFGSKIDASLGKLLSYAIAFAFCGWAGYSAVKKYGGTPFNHGARAGAVTGAFANLIRVAIVLFLLGYGAETYGNVLGAFTLIVASVGALVSGGIWGAVSGTICAYLAQQKK